MSSSREVRFEGGRIRVDTRARVVLVDGRAAKLGGRAYDLLDALLQRRDRVVSKQELLDTVWPGLIVEENNLQVQVLSLRRVFGPQAIVTVSGRGYQFVLAPDEGSAPARRVAAEPESGVKAEPETLPSSTALFGRDALIREACTLLTRPDIRCVTLVGPGGSGKTRVAMHVAGVAADRFAGGSFSVMLAAVRDPGFVAAAIAGVLHVEESAGKPAAELVLEFLREREILLMLDNFEHLLAGIEFIEQLQATCPRVKLLVTARSALHRSGEHVLTVPPLPVPQAGSSITEILQSPSVQLFRTRGHAAGVDVAANPSDVEAAAEVCRRLDGLPLAIELAAARLRLLSVRALLERLGRRLHLLTRGSSELPPRQRTLRDTMAWSHDLLEADDQVLFRRLAAFMGGWSLEAAERVAGREYGPDVVLDRLTTLLDHHLIQRIDDVDGQPRFAMLETVREYALERLEASAEADAMGQRHAEYFVEVAEAAEPHFASVARKVWLERLRPDANNLRQALTRVVEKSPDVALAVRLVGALPWMWYFTGQFSEGRRWIDGTLRLISEGSLDSALVQVLAGSARLAIYSSAVKLGHEHAARAIAIARRCDDRRGLAMALVLMGIALAIEHRRDESDAALREAVEQFRGRDDAWGVALATTYRGAALAYEPGKEDAARPLLAEGRARFAAMGDTWGYTTSSHYLGSIELRQGHFEAARRLTEEMLATAQELGDGYRMSRNLHQLAEIALAEQRPEDAASRLLQSLALNVEHGRVGDAALQLRMLARIEAECGRAGHAVRLYGAASCWSGREHSIPPDDPAVNDAALARARATLGEPDAAQEWAWGVATGIDDVLRWARSQHESVSPGP